MLIYDKHIYIINIIVVLQYIYYNNKYKQHAYKLFV